MESQSVNNRCRYLPDPAIIPAFSYKGRRFVSIEEYLTAPFYVCCTLRHNPAYRQDLANYLYMLKRFAMYDLHMLKESLTAFVQELEARDLDNGSEKEDDDGTDEVSGEKLGQQEGKNIIIRSGCTQIPVQGVPALSPSEQQIVCPQRCTRS